MGAQRILCCQRYTCVTTVSECQFMNVVRPSVIWIATLAAVVATVVLLHEMLLPFVAGIALAYGSNGLAIYFPQTRQQLEQDPFAEKGYEKTNSFKPVDFVKDKDWADLLHTLLN
jgi:hypothetical protein